MANVKSRLTPPLMFAFRNANERRDARKAVATAAERQRDVVHTRSVGFVAVTEALLREQVGVDLEMLMNTIALESAEPLDGFEHVQASILNYGFPDLARRTIDEADIGDIGAEIRVALQRYEPRLDPSSIRVHRDMTADKTALKLRFVVDANLVCNPIDVPVEFIADVDYDSGKIAVERV